MVSAARRQQNVRAQQRYRERQKARMRELEDAKKCNSLLQWRVTEASRQAQAASVSSAPASSTSATISGSSMSPQYLDLVSLIADHGIALDSSVVELITSGQIVLGDILRAGLTTLELYPPYKPQTTQAQSREGPRARCKTRKILVLENSTMVQPDTLPDIYSNHLRVREFLIVAALRANAEQIGISFEDMTDKNAPSPFYRNHGRSTESWDTLPPDLRPIASQLRHPHSAYIDVFPFAEVRERLITMMKAQPAILGEGEFCKDLDHAGLICWGSSFNGGEGTGSGAPWDSRSWEAQPWFLKKWWLVVGGTEGVLFQQTRWWHEFRGDRLPDLW